MMYPVVNRRGSNVSINFSNWAKQLLRSEAFNADQCGAPDDLIHMLENCGEYIEFLNIDLEWLC